MKLSDFDYDLPCSFIAQEPLEQRDSSKLMVLESSTADDGRKEGTVCQNNAAGISHMHFHDILEMLRRDDVLVVNDTRVIPARIHARKSTGGKTIIMLVSRISQSRYLCLMGGKNIRNCSRMLISCSGRKDITAEIGRQVGDLFEVEFSEPMDELMDEIGEMPTPPYIRRKLGKKDCERYQTVYCDAGKKGAIAAPTAGFHFTAELLEKIKAKGVIIARVTLHVSLATFLPIHSEDLSAHKTGREYFEVDLQDADLINNRKGRLFVVGTTALKTLESAADESGLIVAQKGFSEIFIYPGYQFRVAHDFLITNFHLPRSTLILLVAAYLGGSGRDRILGAYEVAKKEGYRFFSFGDAMLLPFNG